MILRNSSSLCVLPTTFQLSPSRKLAQMADPPNSSASNERSPLLARLPSRSTSTHSNSSLPPSPTTPTATATDSLSSHLHSKGSDSPPVVADRKRVWKKFGKFVLIWGTIGLVVGICIVQSVRKGGGEFDWKDALKKAGGGGLAGALSMVLQVLLLLPLRTLMNYQYRHGTSISTAYSTLRSQGRARFYAGLLPALIQGPVARFGDTASNVGVLALLEGNEWAKKLPTAIKTALGSLLGALFRMVLMPVDTLKTTMQTEGNAKALPILKDRIVEYGPGTLWNGAWATAAANFVGSFPWFATYNYLSLHLPGPSSSPSVHSHLSFILLKLSRQALIGFISSVVSDTISNSLRVIKTYRQTAQGDVGYRQSIREILGKEGARGLFGRGLKTRLLANGLQGILFSVLWKVFQDLLEGKGKDGGVGGK
ncbi:hypothetical protein JCM5353_001924 [Sporobolomyces roseus]